MNRKARLLRLVSFASVGVALTLVIGKGAAYWLTGSVAVLSSLLDSALDAGASLVNALAIRYAQKPADEDHHFGHGKAEAMAGLGQAVLIGASAVFLLTQAVEHVMTPTAPDQPMIGVWVSLGAIVITLALVLLQSWVAKQVRSVALEADSLHYRSDLFLNTGVIAALLLTEWTGRTWIDPAIAAVIGVYVLGSAGKIALDSHHILMDREVPGGLTQEIREICAAQSGVLGVHDIRTRGSGQDIFIQMHLELPDELPLVQAHLLADGVEQEIIRRYPGAQVLIHQDPHGAVMKARKAHRQLP